MLRFKDRAQPMVLLGAGVVSTKKRKKRQRYEQPPVLNTQDILKRLMS